MSNILKIAFGGSKSVKSNPLYQYDYGQKILFVGLSLPSAYEVHFSNYDETGESKTSIGDETGAIIPDEYLVTGLDIYAWIFLHTGASDGETKYKVRIPVNKRARPSDTEPTPVQQDVITQAIALLNTGVAQAQASAQTATEQAGIATSAANTATQAAETATGAVADVEAAATRAETAAEGAEASATAAGASATAAGASATDAETAKTAALAAKGAAETAATNAEQSATDAGNYAGLAEAAETSAATSATAAEASATAAAGSASAASGSASQAAQKASEASASATAAETSATNAETARKGAETAQAAAETAQASAEEAAANAQQSATTSEWYAERVERFLPTDTASGEIASFPDGADSVPMQSVVVSMEPIQDLHGYDNPWPAGGGKNKFDMEGWFKTVGAEYTKSGNSYTVKIVQSLFSRPFYFSQTNMAISISIGALTNDTEINVRLQLVDADGQIVNDSVVNDSTKKRENKTAAGVRFDWKTFGTFTISEPQIEAGATATAYAPYSNICPISGRDSVTVTRTGRNLFDFTEFARQYPDNCVYDQSTGELSVSALNSLYNIGVAFDFNLDDGGYASAEVKCGTASNVRIRVLYSDGTFTETSGTRDTSTFVRVNTTLRKKRITSIRLNWTSAGTFTLRNFYLTNVKTATAYEPYQGETLSVSWESEAGTVYGGTLDVVSGDFVVDRAMVDLGTLNWMSEASDASGQFRVNQPEIIPLNPKYSSVQCSILKGVAPKSFSSFKDGEIGLSNASTAPILRARSETFTGKTAKEIKAIMQGQQLVYELATPITYHLTPQEVRTLLGANNVWSDAGDTAVTYKADVQLYIDKRISALS